MNIYFKISSNSYHSSNILKHNNKFKKKNYVNFGFFFKYNLNIIQLNLLLKGLKQKHFNSFNVLNKHFSV